MVIAVVAGGFVMLMDLNALRPLVPVIAGFAILCWCCHDRYWWRVNGAQRWIDLGPMRTKSRDWQARPVVRDGRYLASNRRHLDDLLRGYFVPCGILSIFAD